jgi:hypothetical protein
MIPLLQILPARSPVLPFLICVIRLIRINPRFRQYTPVTPPIPLIVGARSPRPLGLGDPPPTHTFPRSPVQNRDRDAPPTDVGVRIPLLQNHR